HRGRKEPAASPTHRRRSPPSMRAAKSISPGGSEFLTLVIAGDADESEPSPHSTTLTTNHNHASEPAAIPMSPSMPPPVDTRMPGENRAAHRLGGSVARDCHRTAESQRSKQCSSQGLRHDEFS